MNYLMEKVYNIAGYYFQRDKPIQERSRDITKYQKYFEKVYQLLSWEDVTTTLVVFLILNYIFWLVVQVDIKIIGLLFLICLILFIWESFFTNEEQFSDNNNCTEIYDNIRIVIYDTMFKLKSFRKDNPSTFCAAMCLIFFILRFIARSLSGYEIAYYTLLFIFFLPLGFKLLPEEQADNLKNNISSLFNFTGILAEEELIPFLKDNLTPRDNDLDSLLSDRTADSISTSLISGITTMPSYLDLDTQNDVQEEDLLPNRNISCDFSSESDSDQKEMSFASSHFNTDSSSEDEKLLEKDIKFTNDIDDAEPSTLSNFATMGNNLMRNIYQSFTQKSDKQVDRKNSDSSSSSEFEFVSSDDVK